jgi:small subunit ribosomal protein S5
MRPMRGGRFGTRGGRFGGGGGRGGRGPRRDRGPQEKPEFDQKTLDIARVARVTKGGKRFSFRATVVAGNGKGKVGVGVAKGRDVQQSLQKAFHQSKKRLVTVTIKDGTIPYQVEGKYSSAVVLLKPSKSGVKAGGAVRVIAHMAGISSLTGKLTRRTNNKINIARATLVALQSIRADKVK